MALGCCLLAGFRAASSPSLSSSALRRTHHRPLAISMRPPMATQRSLQGLRFCCASSSSSSPPTPQEPDDYELLDTTGNCDPICSVDEVSSQYFEAKYKPKNDLLKALAIIATALAGAAAINHSWVAANQDIAMVLVFAIGYAGIIFEESLAFNKSGVALLMAVCLWVIRSIATLMTAKAMYSRFYEENEAVMSKVRDLQDDLTKANEGISERDKVIQEMKQEAELQEDIVKTLADDLDEYKMKLAAEKEARAKDASSSKLESEAQRREIKKLREEADALKAEVAELRTSKLKSQEELEELRRESSAVATKAAECTASVASVLSEIGAPAQPKDFDESEVIKALDWIKAETLDFSDIFSTYGDYCCASGARAVALSLRKDGCSHVAALGDPTRSYPAAEDILARDQEMDRISRRVIGKAWLSGLREKTHDYMKSLWEAAEARERERRRSAEGTSKEKSAKDAPEPSKKKPDPKV